MTTNDDGSIDFTNGEGVIFRFEKTNYDKHVKKRPKLRHGRFLAEVEKTIKDPDVITEDPKIKNKKCLYKVISYQEGRNVRYVYCWKIPVFYESKNLAKIATCIDKYSPNFYVVNPLEKIVCKKQNSQI